MDEPLLTWAAAKERMQKYRNVKRDRGINTAALGLLVFITADGLLFPSFPYEQIVVTAFFLAGAIGIIYVYVNCWLSAREPGFFCCRCKPRLFLNRTGSWKCPHCLVDDYRGSDFYSFLAPCRNCKKESSGLRCPHCGNAFFLEQGEDEMLWAQIPGGKPKPPAPVPPPIPKKQPTILERIEANLELEMRKELLMQMGPMQKIEALKKEFPHYPEEVWEKLAEKYNKPDDLRYPIDAD